jgi:hypothetical protein
MNDFEFSLCNLDSSSVFVSSSFLISISSVSISFLFSSGKSGDVNLLSIAVIRSSKPLIVSFAVLICNKKKEIISAAAIADISFISRLACEILQIKNHGPIMPLLRIWRELFKIHSDGSKR